MLIQGLACDKRQYYRHRDPGGNFTEYLNSRFPPNSLFVFIFFRFHVGVAGIGPTASVLSGQRSTTELHARQKNYIKYMFYLQTKIAPWGDFCFLRI